MVDLVAGTGGRAESPATDMEMPVSTSPSASTWRKPSSPTPPGWRSTASPAWRAIAAARPSICSPVSRWDSSQSATAEILDRASPIPERTKRTGASRITSRSMTTAIGLGTPYEPRPASLRGRATARAEVRTYRRAARKRPRSAETGQRGRGDDGGAAEQGDGGGGEPGQAPRGGLQRPGEAFGERSGVGEVRAAARPPVGPREAAGGPGRANTARLSGAHPPRWRSRRSRTADGST
ncbi:hypothetical protein SANTM175S_00623 [Streptomyces antimycoticus]